MSGPTQAQSLIPGCSTPRSCEFVSVSTGPAHRKRELQRSDDGRPSTSSHSFQEWMFPPLPGQVPVEPTDTSNVPTAHGAVEASPVKKSSIEQPTKRKKRKRIRSFLRNVWTAIKSPSGCCSDSKAVDVVEPFVPPLDLDSEPDSDPDHSSVEPNHAAGRSRSRRAAPTLSPPDIMSTPSLSRSVGNVERGLCGLSSLCSREEERSSNNSSESQHEQGSDGNGSLSRSDSLNGSLSRSDSFQEWMCPPLPVQVSVESTDTSNVPTAHGAVEASPVNKSSTEKPTKRKKRKRIRLFLKNVWTAIKSPSGCCSDTKAVDVVEPFVPPLDLDSEPDSDPDHSSVEPNHAAGRSSSRRAAPTLSSLDIMSTPSLSRSVGNVESGLSNLSSREEERSSNNSSESQHEQGSDGNGSLSRSDSLNGSLSRSDSFQEWMCPPLPVQVSVESTDTSNVPTAHGAVEASPVNKSSTDLVSEPDSDPDLSVVKPNHESFESLYNTGEMIGYGGYGRVFKGTRKFDGKKVAIKRMRKNCDDLYLIIPGHPKPLITEVALLLMMRQEPISPYTIQLHDWFEHPRKFTLVMDYPEPCESLLEFIYHNPQLDETTARVIMRQAVLAVQHCIEHNVFYNDIHADNFLLKKDTLELKLIDFGAGQILSSDGYDSDVYIGVEFYFPPEVFTEPRFHPVPVNVWALGVLLFEMMNTFPPFHDSKEIKKAKVRFQNTNLSTGLDTPFSLQRTLV